MNTFTRLQHEEISLWLSRSKKEKEKKEHLFYFLYEVSNWYVVFCLSFQPSICWYMITLWKYGLCRLYVISLLCIPDLSCVVLVWSCLCSSLVPFHFLRAVHFSKCRLVTVTVSQAQERPLIKPVRLLKTEESFQTGQGLPYFITLHCNQTGCNYMALLNHIVPHPAQDKSEHSLPEKSVCF